MGPKQNLEIKLATLQHLHLVLENISCPFPTACVPFKLELYLFIFCSERLAPPADLMVCIVQPQQQSRTWTSWQESWGGLNRNSHEIHKHIFHGSGADWIRQSGWLILIVFLKLFSDLRNLKPDQPEYTQLYSDSDFFLALRAVNYFFLENNNVKRTTLHVLKCPKRLLRILPVSSQKCKYPLDLRKNELRKIFSLNLRARLKWTCF